MANLRKIKIKDLGRVFTGSTPPTNNEIFWGDEFLFIKPSDINFGIRYVYNTETRFSKEATKTAKGRLLPAGTTCVVCIGTIGKICQMRISSATNQQINSIVVNRKEFDPDYVYHLMTQSIANVKVVEGGSASGRDHVKKSTFEEIELDVLPLSEQLKVSKIANNYDFLIENNNRRIAILEEMARSLYREWFVKFRYPGKENKKFFESPLGLIPEGWEVKTLSEIGNVNPENISAKLAPENIHYIDISSVGNGSIDEQKDMAFLDAPSRARRKVSDGDIIWATVRPNRKQFAYISNPKKDTVVSTGFAVLRANKVPASFLYYACTTDDFVSYLVNHATGSAYPAVNSGNFEKALLVIPAYDILKEFDNVVSRLLRIKSVLFKKNENLKLQRDMLLPKLIAGSITTKIGS